MTAIRQQTETTEDGQPYQTTSSSLYAAEYTTDDQNQLTAALTTSFLSMVFVGLDDWFCRCQVLRVAVLRRKI